MAPDTSSFTTDVANGISKLSINQNVQNDPTNTTAVVESQSSSIYRWADEMDDTDSSFNRSNTDASETEYEEEKLHTAYVVKLSNLVENTTATQIREILPRELSIYHITFDPTDNSALVSFKDDRHMLKALQSSGKIIAPNSNFSGNRGNKDNYVFIDPWEDCRGRDSRNNIKTSAPIYSMTRNKHSNNNLTKAYSERFSKLDASACGDEGKSRSFELRTSRSVRDEPKSLLTERPKLILKPRSKPLIIEKKPDLPMISEVDIQVQTPKISRNNTTESTDSKQSYSTQNLNKKKSIDRPREYYVDNHANEVKSMDYLKKSHKYKFERSEKPELNEKIERIEIIERIDRPDNFGNLEKLESYERVERYEKHERHGDKYENIEKIEHTERVEKSSRSSRKIRDSKDYVKEYNLDSSNYGDDYRKESTSTQFVHKNSTGRMQKGGSISYNDRNSTNSGNNSKFVKKKSANVSSENIKDSFEEPHRLDEKNYQFDLHKNDFKVDHKDLGKLDKDSHAEKISSRSTEKKSSRAFRKKNSIDAIEPASSGTLGGNKAAGMDERRVKHIANDKDGIDAQHLIAESKSYEKFTVLGQKEEKAGYQSKKFYSLPSKKGEKSKSLMATNDDRLDNHKDESTKSGLKPENGKYDLKKGTGDKNNLSGAQGYAKELLKRHNFKVKNRFAALGEASFEEKKTTQRATPRKK